MSSQPVAKTKCLDDPKKEWSQVACKMNYKGSTLYLRHLVDLNKKSKKDLHLLLIQKAENETSITCKLSKLSIMIYTDEKNLDDLTELIKRKSVNKNVMNDFVSARTNLRRNKEMMVALESARTNLQDEMVDIIYAIEIHDMFIKKTEYALDTNAFGDVDAYPVDVLCKKARRSSLTMKAMQFLSAFEH
jgi:hypothetical protein